MKTYAKRRRKNEGLLSDKKVPIVPIILAAGKPRRLEFPQALARFGRRTALEIALRNCRGLGRPVVVVGYCAARVRMATSRDVRIVVHRGWQAGQLSSLRAGLRKVPSEAAFMLYPVDYPRLTPSEIRSLVEKFRSKRNDQTIVFPVYRGRSGHPVIFSAEMRRELGRAQSAREVVKKDPRRVKMVQVRTAAIWQDFNTPSSYLQHSDNPRMRNN